MDISFIVNELQAYKDSWIDNVYEVNNLYLLKLRGSSKSNKGVLLIEPSKRLHLTEYKRNTPERPSDKLLSLRKHIRKGKITSIEQYGNDRIIILTIETETKTFQIINEIFAKGNAILVELYKEDNELKTKVIFALWYKIMRDRILLPGKSYTFPPSRGDNILGIHKKSSEDLFSENKDNDSEIVRFLARTYNMSGDIAEEILARCKIQKKTKVLKISLEQWELINSKTKEVLGEKLNPQVIYEEENPISVTPFDFVSIEGKKVQFPTFNRAVDEFFTFYESHAPPDDQSPKIKQLKNLIEKQQEHIINIKEKSAIRKRNADLVYAHFAQTEELFKIIMKARKNNVTWEEIITKLEIGKEKGIASAMIFHSLNPATKTIELKLDEEIIDLDFTRKVTDITNELYKRSKKEMAKIEPALEIIKKTEVKLQEAMFKQEKNVEKAQLKLKQRKKRWYETYRWTITDNGFLVVAGRDARTNEVLVRKRMEKDDLFFHADLHGAPYTLLLIQDKNKEDIQDKDKEQAATIAASYSSAWKANFTSTDVYQVSADQVSFAAPSGESLARGSIMVRGQRNYIKNVQLKLFIGIVIEESSSLVIVGDREFIQKQTDIFKELKPGTHKKSDVAKSLKKIFIKAASEEKKAIIETIDLNDLIAMIPGPSEIIFNKK